MKTSGKPLTLTQSSDFVPGAVVWEPAQSNRASVDDRQWATALDSATEPILLLTLFCTKPVTYLLTSAARWLSMVACLTALRSALAARSLARFFSYSSSAVLLVGAAGPPRRHLWTDPES